MSPSFKLKKWAVFLGI